MFRNFFITLIFGALIGLSTSVYIMGLDLIQSFHKENLLYPYFLLPVLVLLVLTKRNTLYFPTSVHQVTEAPEVEQKYWSRWGYPLNLVGSWLSHAAGASLGREGTVLVLSSHLAQICRLDWNFFKPIILSAALASVMGQPLISVIIILELFKTNSEQKLFALLMAWIAILITQSVGLKPLFVMMSIDGSGALTSKLLVVLAIGVCAGLMSLYYKKYSLFLFNFFKQQRWLAALVVIALTGLFLIPQFKPLHSLSLPVYEAIQRGEVEPHFILLKILFTLLFTSLGFLGGDFVPSIIVGSGLGVGLAQYFQVPYMFGFVMGLFSIFVGITRLKWTAFWMIFLLFGWAQLPWAYLVLSLSRYFSGPISFYKKLPEVKT